MVILTYFDRSHLGVSIASFCAVGSSRWWALRWLPQPLSPDTLPDINKYHDETCLTKIHRQAIELVASAPEPGGDESDLDCGRGSKITRWRKKHTRRESKTRGVGICRTLRSPYQSHGSTRGLLTQKSESAWKVKDIIAIRLLGTCSKFKFIPYCLNIGRDCQPSGERRLKTSNTLSTVSPFHFSSVSHL